MPTEFDPRVKAMEVDERRGSESDSASGSDSDCCERTHRWWRVRSRGTMRDEEYTVSDVIIRSKPGSSNVSGSGSADPVLLWLRCVEW